jgi:hypothetical protein
VTVPRTAAGEGHVRLPTAAAVAGLDVATRHERDADAVAVRLAQLVPVPWRHRLVVATHVERRPPAHVVLTIEVPADVAGVEPALRAAVHAAGLAEPALVLGKHTSGPAEHVTHACLAVTAHIAARSGRVVVAPGLSDLPERLLVAELLERGVVERVEVLAGGVAAPDAVLVPRGFLRPRWSQGSLVLHVQPGAGGVLVPFEVPDPTPCCADHP